MPTAELLCEEDRAWGKWWWGGSCQGFGFWWVFLSAAKVERVTCDSSVRVLTKKHQNKTETKKPIKPNKTLTHKKKHPNKKIFKKKESVVCLQLCVSQQTILLAGAYCSSNQLQGLSLLLRVRFNFQMQAA